MSSIRRNVHLLISLGLLSMTMSPPIALAQAEVAHTPQIIGIVINAEKDKGVVVKEVDLRPNTPTGFGFELRNNAGEILGDVSLKIVQVVNGKDHVLAETTIPKLDPTAEKAKGLVVQTFDKIKGAPEKLELVGAPPFKLEIHVQAKNLALTRRELKLVIREPREYLAATAKFNPSESILNVEVEPKGDGTFIGQHLLPVNLVLGPDIKPSKNGVFKQTLTAPNQKLPLIAEEFGFERTLTEGDVYLKVDGYDRAFTYPVKENASGAIEPRPAGEIRVRISVPRYARPNAKFEVPLEIDGPLSGDYKVRVGLDRTGDTDDVPASDLQEFVGLRKQSVSLSVSKSGQLLCLAEVRDWQAKFDTADIFGRNIKIRVSVIKDKEKVKIAVAQESRPLMARIETDDREKEIKSVFAQVTIDESAPEGLNLVLPKDKEGTAGEPLEISASIKERKLTQAPIARVIVFRGKAPKDDKEEIKADDIIAVEVVSDPRQKLWKLTLPAQATPGPLALSVQFTTQTGAKATVTDMLTLKPATPKKEIFTIKGHVLRGPLGQPGLVVTLIDAKKNIKGTVKTNDKGAFVFENVEPGTYIVASRDSVQNLIGNSGPVNVPDKKKKELDVTISLLRK